MPEEEILEHFLSMVNGDKSMEITEFLEFNWESHPVTIRFCFSGPVAKKPIKSRFLRVRKI